MGTREPLHVPAVPSSATLEQGWSATSPECAALAILQHRFAPEHLSAATPGDGGVIRLADFQATAAARARRTLARRGGVVLADSVGLGKTFVGLALVEVALRAGERVAVITPASVGREWRRPLRRLARRLRIGRTIGLEQAVRARGARRGTALLAWLTHTRLSRGTHVPERLEPLDLIVVDEAHGFRSPRTRRYAALARLCRQARVVLLTATPVNNSIWDLYHLLRLFAGDAAFADVGIPDLRAATAAAATGQRPDALEPAIRGVLIRRTRRVLRSCYGIVRVPQGDGPSGRFPARAPPVAVRYDLEAAYPGFLAELAELVASLSLAPYQLAEYGAPFARAAGPGQTALLRLVLLKRLESGAAAFRATLRRQVRFYEAFLGALGAGRLLRPVEHRYLYATGDAGTVQLVLETVALPPIPAGVAVDRLEAAAREDLYWLRRAADRVAPVESRDPKIDVLAKLMVGSLAGRKVLLFTEFRETARDLWRALVDRGRVALVDGHGGILGRQPCPRRAVIDRFAPISNGVRAPPDRERVDLLIATDVLAEGLNLQDADHVVSYDLPWNPVRLAQRVGRIDRLGSVAEVIRTYYFLPDSGLDALLGLLHRLDRKLGAIRLGFGGGADGFTGYMARLADGDVRVLEEAEEADETEEPVLTCERLHALLRQRGSGSGPPGAAPTLPLAAAVVGSGPSREILVAMADGDRHRWATIDSDGVVNLDEQTAERLLLHVLADRPAQLPIEDAVFRAAVDAALRGVLEADVIAQNRARHRAGSPAARAARRLLKALARMPGGPPPDVSRRAEAVLEHLARGVPAGSEAVLRDLLVDSRGAEAMLDRIEAALPGLARGASSPARQARTEGRTVDTDPRDALGSAAGPDRPRRDSDGPTRARARPAPRVIGMIDFRPA